MWSGLWWTHCVCGARGEWLTETWGEEVWPVIPSRHDFHTHVTSIPRLHVLSPSTFRSAPFQAQKPGFWCFRDISLGTIKTFWSCSHKQMKVQLRQQAILNFTFKLSVLMKGSCLCSLHLSFNRWLILPAVPFDGETQHSRKQTNPK